MKVGFIGLGNVGKKLAGSLLRHAFEVTVRDAQRSAAVPLLDAGAVWADSGRTLARSCDVVITCLPSPLGSAQVLEEPGGVLEGLGSGKIWIARRPGTSPFSPAATAPHSNEFFRSSRRWVGKSCTQVGLVLRRCSR